SYSLFLGGGSNTSQLSLHEAHASPFESTLLPPLFLLLTCCFSCASNLLDLASLQAAGRVIQCGLLSLLMGLVLLDVAFFLSMHT
ncbi:hypothetical protein VIGAN_09104600, partial [Vigna angularis var. angularis]